MHFGGFANWKFSKNSKAALQNTRILSELLRLTKLIRTQLQVSWNELGLVDWHSNFSLFERSFIEVSERSAWIRQKLFSLEECVFWFVWLKP